jgi:hypothetical protein
MAQIIPKAFRLVTVTDLSDSAKMTDVVMEQITEISHDASREQVERTYEDSDVPQVSIARNLSGNITIKGDVMHYVTPSYAATTRTDALFEVGHYYMIRFLSLNFQASPATMIYHRWVGQCVDLPQKTLTAGGEPNEAEIKLAVALFTDGHAVSIDYTKPYLATADRSTTWDSGPSADYWPLFEAEVADTTKTLAAAEALISAAIINPNDT